jgi:hypothetical protein
MNATALVGLWEEASVKAIGKTNCKLVVMRHKNGTLYDKGLTEHELKGRGLVNNLPALIFCKHAPSATALI